jgi:hypothetical protein
MRSSKIMRKPQSTRTERSEDVLAARIVRKAKAAVAAGQEILLPKIVVDRLVAGKDTARILRAGQGKKLPPNWS